MVLSNHAIKTNSNKINKREWCNHSEEVDRQLNLKAVEKKTYLFQIGGEAWRRMSVTYRRRQRLGREQERVVRDVKRLLPTDRNQKRLNLDVILYRCRERHGRDKRELWERRRGLCPTWIPSPIGCCHLWRRTSSKTS